ncbi:MAG TPA: hydroxymethylglutaryl-CoA reductase [Bacteroides sp.]|nr:hydroxymethylglutaryl-CoA reductase [Bacteroides sp.]
MSAPRIVHGFSKLSREKKLEWLQKQAGLAEESLRQLDAHIHPDRRLQEIYEEISENTVSNYFLPFSLAPNFLINGELMTVPMVTEESSVVAAASHAARFWAMHGGFRAEVSDTLRVGQVHFTWSGQEPLLYRAFQRIREQLKQSVQPLTSRMEQRGGGIDAIRIRPGSGALPGYYQLFVTFRTSDAMGANFINSVLEAMAANFSSAMRAMEPESELSVVMSILSNYTPESRVTCSVEGDTNIFNGLDKQMSGNEFARKFKLAVDIAQHDPYRAVTHNKGIFNGMDAVVIATGNDFRAVEACGHAFAARDGSYAGLSHVELSGNIFRFTLEIPLALGTVGGLTGIHPLAGTALDILDRPSSVKLMQIVAAAGLANNFSAVRSLITTGIQQGHMKMHLSNILRQLGASSAETERAEAHFRERTVSFAEVVNFLESVRLESTDP